MGLGGSGSIQSGRVAPPIGPGLNSRKRHLPDTEWGSLSDRTQQRGRSRLFSPTRGGLTTLNYLEITARCSMTLVLVGAAGCTAPPVSDLDGGRYHLAVRAEHGQEGLDLDRANAAQLADKYCRKSGQRAKIEGYDQEGPFVASPAVGVIFKCEQPSHEEMPHHAYE